VSFADAGERLIEESDFAPLRGGSESHRGKPPI